MKIFESNQIRKIDEYTIKHEPVLSIDLMERAAFTIYKWYSERFDRSKRVLIFAGPGNNGGDGLALARMLAANRFKPEVYNVKFTEKTSEDHEKNMQRLENETSVTVNIITEDDQFPLISQGDIVIDAIFGSGLSRPAEGLAAEIIRLINGTGATVIAIDIPSGLPGEDSRQFRNANIIHATFTLCFQFPKLVFLFPENEQFTGNLIILPIGLHKTALRDFDSPYFFLEKSDIAPVLNQRKKFDHKGMFGHGLLIAGSHGKMGAAVLSAKAALRTGIGLLTCHIPAGGNIIMQTAVPEAMVETDISERFISEDPVTEKYSAVGIGPGTGTGIETGKVLFKLLSSCTKPMVIDADGLNILAMNRDWYKYLRPEIILTPHPKEFERLAGPAADSFERLNKQVKFSADNNCIVVLKGAYTSISTPEGKVYFNSTGNPGMATGGSGDVLTGMILSLLAQGYLPENAAKTGVYLHGFAGDIAAEKSSMESMLPSDLVNEIGDAIKRVRNPDHL